ECQVAPVGEAGRGNRTDADVADDAAAAGHHEGDGDDAEQVEVLLPRGDRAADGEGEGAGHVEQGEQQVFFVHGSALRPRGLLAWWVAGAGSGGCITPPLHDHAGRTVASLTLRGVGRHVWRPGTPRSLGMTGLAMRGAGFDGA